MISYIDVLKNDESVWPDGATHWDSEAELFVSPTHIYMPDGKQQRQSQKSLANFGRYIPRPAHKGQEPGRIAPKPADKWADGLPPVGCECEVLHLGRTWEKCEIVAHVRSVEGAKAVWQLIGYNEWSGDLADNFRPLRTQAERERIDTIVKAKYAAEDVVGFEVDEAICAALYDANLLRKPAEEVGREELAELSAKALTVRCGTMLEEWQYDTLADAILSTYNVTEK